MQADPNPSTPAILDDETVVARVKGGETALFEIVMRRYNQRLYRVARSILGTDADVEDVLQETYVRAYRHLDQFEGRARFSTWLTKIAVHEAAARARKSRRLVPLEADVDEESSGVFELRSTLPDPEEAASRAEVRRLVEEAVDRLPDSFREVFVLREIEQLSQAETAECLGLKEETVKTRLFRARRLIESHLLARAGEGLRSVWTFGESRCTSVVTAVLRRLAEG